MSFSRTASSTVVPLLARLVLAAAFIPAGYHKIMGDPVTYEGQDALTLQKLGVGQPPTAVGKMAGSGQDVLGFYQQDVETGRLRDRVRPSGDQDEEAGPDASPAPAPKPRPRTQPAQEPQTQPQEPTVEEPVQPKPQPPKPPAPKPQPKPEPVTPPSAPPADGASVTARPLYRVALMLDGAGRPQKLRPDWMAWVAAGTELVGGALILIGLFSRVWGLGLAVTMGFAFWLTSYGAVTEHGFFALPIGDFNRAFAQVGLFVMAAGVMMTGAGGLSLDRALFRGGGVEDEEHLLHLG
jgi:uncharacterized membrane protein YphA (DoxX/SURF4 family)